MIFHSRVKGFRQIHEGSVEVSPHLLAFLWQLSSGEDYVECFSVSLKATLTFREQSQLQVSVQAGGDLSIDFQQCDSSVVVAELVVPFLPVEVENGSVLEIQRDLSLVPHLLEEHCELVHQLGSAMPVHVPLDFLGFARHPGILHLPQSLLYKAGTSVEGCLVCSDRAIDVGFVQLVLLDEWSVDSRIIIIEPVLVLTTCAVEDIQGGGLDSVFQLTSAVLHGVVRVSDWKVGLSVDQFVAELEKVSRGIQQNSF
ncbi:unnamed protein product [Schistocephalus solidus]|uniref:VPS13_C domain-containing protein n=1 Tax=Schistocephalus solidus TaxID=70667 RepID=A0A183T763_SCHSO|nr:unnamed protein product [Schistocephalus solidus]